MEDKEISERILTPEQCALLARLMDCWKKNTCLRFGQLMCILVKTGKTQFYLSDQELINKIDEFLEPLP